MRSYSSLLCHILNSNPELAGYVERHRAYVTKRDLMDLRIAAARSTGKPLSVRYAVDKVLHNKAAVHPKILQREDVFALFSLRAPEQTIRSTIAMVRRRGGPKKNWKHNPTKVTDYYVGRLEQLVEMAVLKSSRSFYYDAERLVTDSEGTLAALTGFLGLDVPLHERYETFDLTGEPGFGDPSAFISAGTIVRERIDHQAIEVPSNDLARAREAFERTRDILLDQCDIALDTKPKTEVIPRTRPNR